MPDDIVVKIAKNVKCYRLKAKLTQKELAAKMRCHPSHISNIENAKAKIYTTTLIELAQSFNICPSNLIK